MLGDDVGRVRWSHPVAGLLLGMNDVLHDATAWRRWLLPVLARLGMRVEYEAFYQVWECRYAGEVYCGRRAMGEAFGEFLGSFGLGRAQIDEVESACRTRWRQTDRTSRPLPGVRGTLLRLREAGRVLGVLTDSPCSADVLQERLARFGLDGVFTSVLSSFDLGQTKPNPMGYLRSLHTMGLRPEQVAFVGHRRAELDGAAALGMPTIAFNYHKDVQADVYLDRFDQLDVVLEGGSRWAAAG